jgi:hypothetical protein
VLSLGAAASVCALIAVAAWASTFAIKCTRGGSCVATGSAPGFATKTIAGNGVISTALCLGSVANPCNRVRGELLFGPGILAGAAGLGTNNASVLIVPKLVAVSANHYGVALTASNGAVGIIAFPSGGALCVHLRSLSITASPC